MNEEIKKFESLLKDFSKISINQNNFETFLSICGYPHYERVVSNILSFFFNSKREHGLKNCFSKSLLDLLQINFDPTLDFETITEEKTDSGKFIDILIKNEELNIIIENKIFANLYNDLDDYYNCVSDRYGNNTYGIVLGLHKYITNNENFISVTYEELFEQIRKNLGFFITDSNPKYNVFLYDFMENIQNLTRRPSMNTGLLKFLDDKAEIAQAFDKEITNLRNELRIAVREVNQIIREKMNLPNDILYLWEYREPPAFFDVAVADYSKDDYSFTIDTMLDAKGWTISVFSRRKQNYETSKKFEEKLGKDFPGVVNERFVLEKIFPIDEEKINVADYVCKILDKLINT